MKELPTEFVMKAFVNWSMLFNTKLNSLSRFSPSSFNLQPFISRKWTISYIVDLKASQWNICRKCPQLTLACSRFTLNPGNHHTFGANPGIARLIQDIWFVGADLNSRYNAALRKQWSINRGHQRIIYFHHGDKGCSMQATRWKSHARVEIFHSVESFWFLILSITQQVLLWRKSHHESAESPKEAKRKNACACSSPKSDYLYLARRRALFFLILFLFVWEVSCKE